MLSDWWNGVELWMLGLPFPLQFALVVVVLVPLCLVVAWLIDRIVDHASAFFGSAASPERPLGSAKPEHAEQAEQPEETERPEAGDDDGADADVEAGDTAGEERVPAESTCR